MKAMRNLLLLLLALFLALPLSVNAADARRIKPGDLLNVNVYQEQELSAVYLVGKDGSFAMPLIGKVDCRRKTSEELQKEIEARLREYLLKPLVTVNLQVKTTEHSQR